MKTKKSGIKGITWSATESRWLVRWVDGVACTHYVGRYPTLPQAKVALGAFEKGWLRSW